MEDDSTKTVGAGSAQGLQGGQDLQSPTPLNDQSKAIRRNPRERCALFICDC